MSYSGDAHRIQVGNDVIASDPAHFVGIVDERIEVIRRLDQKERRIRDWLETSVQSDADFVAFEHVGMDAFRRRFGPVRRRVGKTRFGKVRQEIEQLLLRNLASSPYKIKVNALIDVDGCKLSEIFRRKSTWPKNKVSLNNKILYSVY